MKMYVGKQPPGPYYEMSNDASSVVKRLIQPIDNSARNVSMDNYFTSIPLMNDLYHNHKLTVVGTIRKNKPQIPQELLVVRERPKCTSMFAFGKEPNKCTVVSYIPNKKTKKNVLLASTIHGDDEIDPDTGDDQKPSIITFYNLTKGRVDVVDRLKSEYSVTRISNRWPFTAFGGLLNVGAVNAQIIYKYNTNDFKQRRIFVSELAKDLIRPHMIRRASIDSLPKELHQRIRRFTGVAEPVPEQPQEEKGRYAFCPTRKNRFTTRTCITCKKKVCGQHIKTTTYICYPCGEEPQDPGSD